jgi:hypothetical protein
MTGKCGFWFLAEAEVFLNSVKKIKLWGPLNLLGSVGKVAGMLRCEWVKSHLHSPLSLTNVALRGAEWWASRHVLYPRRKFPCYSFNGGGVGPTASPDALVNWTVTALTTLWLGIQCTKYSICGKRGQCFIQQITLQVIHIWEWLMITVFNIHLTQMCVGMPVCLLAKLIDLHNKHNLFTPFYSSLTPTGWKLVC